MATKITNPLITINGVTLNSSETESYKLTYAKLWKDADRNMNGTVSATLIGVFPNIEIKTTKLAFAKAQSLSAAINAAYFSVTFWDSQTGSQKTANFYAADHDVSLLNECVYGQVTIQLVPVSKASYI
jgi:hypothetical protein